MRLMLLTVALLLTAAGAFTTNRVFAAPIAVGRQHVRNGVLKGVVLNSGNANAFTGKKGREATRLTASAAVDAVGCAETDVYLASTGVIGEPLDASKFEGVLEDCAKRVADGPWIDAAKAIMTTDTFPKGAAATVDLDGGTVSIAGIAKGSGMIAPDMATMLSFVVTDADIAPVALQGLLSEGVEPSFNSITVDSDTSTSDTLMLFATGAASADGQAKVERADDARLGDFRAALNDLLKDLALQVVRDGEGARKMVEITVKGAENDLAAKKIAMSIANSPLVKTAVAGEDANWGRIVMAVGKSGEMADRDRLAIWFGDVRVAVNGERDPAYSEEATTAVMEREDIPVTVDIGLGSGTATVWTCDLTKEYVAINGDYRS